MSSIPKRRKVSTEPVLQDFTVSSFSDILSDVGGPSDSSFFEQIKNYEELPNATFNQTSNTNLSSGPYPSDSSLDLLFKQMSNSTVKTNEKTQRPFQKNPKKKLLEENLFDSCLKDSFSDQSLERVHKPFQRKKKNVVRLSTFDSDFELNTTKDSPFKKPFQLKSKIKKRSNLFDSLIIDSQPNTPEQQPRRTLQRKSRKEISSHFFDGVLSSESINQPSPIQNVLTRRISRRKKNCESNLFDLDLNSSQSDVSMPLQPLKFKNGKSSNFIKKSTGVFDDVFDATDNESQTEKSAVLDPCNKSNEDHIDSFNLEYNSIENQVSNEPDAEDEGGKQHKENVLGRISAVEIPNQKEPEDENTRDSDKNEEISVSPKERDKSECADDSEDEGSTESETDNERSRVENKEECESMEQLSDQEEGDDSENIESKDPETEDGGTTIYTENEGDSDYIANLPDKSELTPHGETKATEENTENNQHKSIAHSLNHQSSSNKNSTIEERKNEALNDDDSRNDPGENEDKSQSTVGVAYELNFLESSGVSVESRRSSLRCRGTIPLSNSDLELCSPKIIMEERQNEACKDDDSTNNEDMPICTPDASFAKGLNSQLPTSTPNVEGKTVSFLLKENISNSTFGNDVHGMEMSNNNAKPIDSKKPLLNPSVTGIIKTDVNNKCTFTGRKSSLRTHTGNVHSRSVNNLMKDNSMHLTKRVSFKFDNQKNYNLKQLNIQNSNEMEHSNENRSNNYYTSFSLESLVYNQRSEDDTPDSESVYIDIHPSRGKSTSSSNTESFSTKKSVAEVSTSHAKCKSFKSNDSYTGVTKNRSENDKINDYKENNLSIDQTDHENNNAIDNDSEEDRTICNSDIDEEFSDCANKSKTFSKELDETITGNELEGREEEEPEIEEEEESEIEEEEASEVEKEEESETEEKEEESEEEQDAIDEEEEPERGENEESELEDSVDEEDQGVEDIFSKNTGHKEFDASNHVSSPEPDDNLFYEQDENVNPGIKLAGEFEFPFKVPKQKRRMRTSSLFKDISLDVPSKSQLKDILNKIPFSELKNRKKRKSSEHSVSEQQMQQYEIEEELMRNQHQQKAHSKKTFSASSKLKRPKKWVTPRLYDFLISKLNPRYGIRSRVRAEELVLFLVKHVECIKKRKELIREDVDEMKIELARLGVIETHWDFFKFVIHYLDYFVKEKMYPSLPGVGHSAFEFGPSNVFESII